jgi:hypothetical protein
MPQQKILRLILGDQLNEKHSCGKSVTAIWHAPLTACIGTFLPDIENACRKTLVLQ